MKRLPVVVALLVTLAHGVHAQEAGPATQAISFSGASKATEFDSRFRQHVIQWMSGEVERKTGCKLKSIEASSPPYVEQWAGVKPANAARREVEIWKVTYCQRASSMLVRFDFTDKGVNFTAEQIGASEDLSPPAADAATNK